MKIVIDIPDENYKRDNLIHFFGCYSEKLDEVIKNGTPLPKGHGRIADMDAAIKCIEEVEGEDAVWAISLIEWACSKRRIIEADKEQEDEKESLDRNS